MGRKIIAEQKLMRPKPLVVAVADSLARPYYQPFAIVTHRIERTPTKGPRRA